MFAVNPIVVDVAVVYTPAARVSVGGADKITQRVRRAVADTNFILANSQVDGVVRVVSVTETSYSESYNLSTDLSRLQNTSDGYLDSVHALRNATGADLVHLLVADGDDGGRAYQLDDPSQSWADYGFGVSQAKYTNIEYIFAHETMHSLGAGHDDVDSTPRGLPYAYGLAVKSGNQIVNTLMGPGTRIPYLSNPALTWRGQPLGAAEGSAKAQQLGHAADNAKAVRAFLPIVAANRAVKVADSTAPSARLVQSWVSASGKTLNLEVALADDSAINIATLDSGDLRVTGPAGFNKPAVYVGVDRATNGAQRLARYTVDITGFSKDAGAYTTALNAGQIRDLKGFAVPSLGGSSAIFGSRAGPNLQTAMELGAVNGTSRQINNSLGLLDFSPLYRFTLASSATVTAKLSGLAANANLAIVRDSNTDGIIDSSEILASSSSSGATVEQLTRSLQAGVYSLWVTSADNVATPYTLSIAASGAPTVPAPVTGSISGNVWRDNNSNGIRDSWEAALAGWKVYADVNANGKFDAGTDPQATTTTTGSYTLSNLAAKTYVIRSLDQAGYRRTTASSITVNLAAGQSVTGKNFGHTPRVLVSGSVFHDANKNRIREATETGATGWTVYLDRNDNSRLDTGELSTVSDTAGNWSIKDALAGAYVVKLVGKSGMTSTPIGGYTLSLAAGQTSTGKTFGVQKV